MIRRIYLAVVACIVSCVAANAWAVPVAYTTVLSGANENPAVLSPGTGTANVVIDTDTDYLLVEAMFNGLVGTTTAAHIHGPAIPPANAGVATQTPSFSGFPLGVTSGNYGQTFDLSLTSTYRSNFIATNGGTPAGAKAALALMLADGQAYFNIHTSFAGGGEIRGFFALAPTNSAIPEPASAALALLGITGMSLAMLRRRAVA